MIYDKIIPVSVMVAMVAVLVYGCSSGNVSNGVSADETMNTEEDSMIVYPDQTLVDTIGLGAMEQISYRGLLSSVSDSCIEYLLEISSLRHSGDGIFQLTLICQSADKGKDTLSRYTGQRFTQRGIPGNNNATVWQCVSDRGNEIFNFLKENDSTLILLNGDFELSHTRRESLYMYE